MKHNGNLTITSANKEQFKDLVEVSGNLVIETKITLKKLQTIGGYLDVSAEFSAPVLQTIGGYLDVSAEFSAPVLQTIGGSLYVNEKFSAPVLQTIGGSLYVSAEFSAPEFKKDVKTPPEVTNEIKFNAKQSNRNDFERQGYLFADDILQKIVSKKTVKTLTIYKTKPLAKDKTQFVVFDGTNYSHGETLEQAKADLMFKITSRDTSEFRSWKVTDVKPVEELIKAYRTITGACATGTKDFCSSIELKKEYKVKDIFKLTEGKYGHDTFKAFFA